MIQRNESFECVCDYNSYMNELKGYYYSEDYETPKLEKTFAQYLAEHAKYDPEELQKYRQTKEEKKAYEEKLKRCLRKVIGAKSVRLSKLNNKRRIRLRLKKMNQERIMKMRIRSSRMQERMNPYKSFKKDMSEYKKMRNLMRILKQM